MRDQYAGDISDLLKFALLHYLAGQDRRLGIGWYYNPVHDGSSHGSHTEYRSESKWMILDPVYAALKGLPERSVAALETLAFWPAGTRFHREPIPDYALRRAWTSGMQVALADADLVYLDPDNGIGTTERHATLAEVACMRRPGRSVVVIQFPARRKFSMQADELHRVLKEGTGSASLLTVRTRVSLPARRETGMKLPRFRWFTVIDSDDALAERIEAYVQVLNRVDSAAADLVRG